MIFDVINEDVKTAMKSKDSETLLTLRTLCSDIKNFEIGKKGSNKNEKPDDPSVMEVLFKNLSQSEDSLEIYIQGNRQDLVDSTMKQIAIYKKYLPTNLLSKAEISEIIQEAFAVVRVAKRKDILAKGDFRAIMDVVKVKTSGKAYEKQVSKMISEIL